MQKATYCIVSGFIIYLISLFLPAYMHILGYETLFIALKAPFQNSIPNLAVLIHVFFLGIHNLLLISALGITQFFTDKMQSWLILILFISLINVIGFFFVILARHSVGDLQIGYYLWVIASLLIVGGVYWKHIIFGASKSE